MNLTFGQCVLLMVIWFGIRIFADVLTAIVRLIYEISRDAIREDRQSRASDKPRRTHKGPIGFQSVVVENRKEES